MVFGRGHLRDVIYREQPACHIVPDGVYVHTERRADHWLMRTETEIVGDRAGPLIHRLIETDGRCIAAGENELTVVSPRLWSPDFYTLESELCVGEIVRRRVGFRAIRMEPDTGLYINGEYVKLHGACLHHDLDAAFYEKAARRQLELMKRMRVNALRIIRRRGSK